MLRTNKIRILNNFSKLLVDNCSENVYIYLKKYTKLIYVAMASNLVLDNILIVTQF